MKKYVVIRIVISYAFEVIQTDVVKICKHKETAWECIGKQFEKVWNTSEYYNSPVNAVKIMENSAIIILKGEEDLSNSYDFIFKIKEAFEEDDE